MVKHKRKKKLKVSLWVAIIAIILTAFIYFIFGMYFAIKFGAIKTIPDLQDCLQACQILRTDKYVLYDYHSYTKALNQRQDYYIECSGHNLINITPIGSPIFLDNFTGGFCL